MSAVGQALMTAIPKPGRGWKAAKQVISYNPKPAKTFSCSTKLIQPPKSSLKNKQIELCQFTTNLPRHVRGFFSNFFQLLNPI